MTDLEECVRVTDLQAREIIVSEDWQRSRDDAERTFGSRHAALHH